jgi:hypothetical protein
MTVTPSTALLTNLATVAATAPTANTIAKAKSTAGEDLDYAGMISAAGQALDQARETLIQVSNATDSADGNLALLANILASLS